MVVGWGYGVRDGRSASSEAGSCAHDKPVSGRLKLH